MEDLSQSNHALDISEMSNIHLDPTELQKQSMKKSEAGTTNGHNHDTNGDNQVTTDDERVEHAYEIVLFQSQPRKSVTEKQHEGLVKAILKDLVRLSRYIYEDFEGDEPMRYKELNSQLTKHIVELAGCDLEKGNADGKEGDGHEEQEYGLKVD